MSAPSRISTIHSPLRIVIPADRICPVSLLIKGTTSNVTAGTAVPVLRICSVQMLFLPVYCFHALTPAFATDNTSLALFLVPGTSLLPSDRCCGSCILLPAIFVYSLHALLPVNASFRPLSLCDLSPWDIPRCRVLSRDPSRSSEFRL